MPIRTESHDPWPFAILDFEASALKNGSYPIEIGISYWAGTDQPAHTWSALIKPTTSWSEAGIWAVKSQQVHKIHPEALEIGLSPALALATAEAFVASLDCPILCDGGHWDNYWLTRLENAAGAIARFELGSLHAHTRDWSADQQLLFDAFIKSTPIPHRAGPDAEIPIKGLAQSLQIPAPTFMRHFDLPGHDSSTWPI